MGLFLSPRAYENKAIASRGTRHYKSAFKPIAFRAYMDTKSVWIMFNHVKRTRHIFMAQSCFYFLFAYGKEQNWRRASIFKVWNEADAFMKDSNLSMILSTIAY